jgi:hypothetical protein
MYQQLKNEMLDFIKQGIPQGLDIVEQSIPVLFFGNLVNAEHATISINPSNIEFVQQNGELLLPKDSGVEKNKTKRFIERSCFGCADTDPLDKDQAEQVYASLLAYFQPENNPYDKWFKPLNQLLEGIGVSFYDNSLVHLDMTPWATKKKYSGLTPEEKTALLNYSWAKKILQAGKIKCLFVNGRAAMNHVETCIATFNEYKHTNNPCTIKTGSFGICKIIAWSANINNPRKSLTEKEKQDLNGIINELYNKP